MVSLLRGVYLRRANGTARPSPEEEAAGALQEDMAHEDLYPGVLIVDRAYLNSTMARGRAGERRRHRLVDRGEEPARSPDSSATATLK